MLPTSVHVLGLWSAVALLSLPDALVLRDPPRSGTDNAVYVAVNLFAILAVLALLAHASASWGARAEHRYAPLPPGAKTSARAELAHVFLHVLCVLYVRVAVWFELRARG